MLRALMDTLDWYSEATPQDRLEDGGERAANLLVQLQGEGDDGDMLAVLLARVEAVLNRDHDVGDTSAQEALRQSLMEWQE